MSLFRVRHFFLLILLLSLTMPSMPSHAQQADAMPDSTREAASASARNALYVELLGAGLLYSINYDRHLIGRMHARVGYATFGSGFGSGDSNLHLVPVQLMFVSDAQDALEIGAGVTMIVDRGRNAIRPHDSSAPSSNLKAMASFSVGYRYQPIESGFLFRIGFTPFIGYDGRFLPFGGISFGYAF